MTSMAPWALALGIDPDGCDRVVVDVRRGALPVCMVEARPDSRAAASLSALVGRLDAATVVRPMGEPERDGIEEILADMQDDARSLAMSGDNGRAEYAGHYAGRIERVLGAVS